MNAMSHPVTGHPAAESVRVEPRFHDMGGHRLFAVHWLPQGPARGTVVCLPALAEEMNRCRTHVADTARALAAHGWHCVAPDPYGTGESEGSSEDADWHVWVQDTLALLATLRNGTGPVVLWGVRTGALLAAAAACATPAAVSHLLFWQPVLDGSLFLNQYLRLRIASQVVHAGDKETTDGLRRRLAAGETLEIAGYPLTGGLATALDGQKMAAMSAQLPQPLRWLEVVPQPGAAASPASRKLIDSWPTSVQLETVSCPMVWQVYDRMAAPELVQGSLRLLKGLGQ